MSTWVLYITDETNIGISSFTGVVSHHQYTFDIVSSYLFYLSNIFSLHDGVTGLLFFFLLESVVVRDNTRLF